MKNAFLKDIWRTIQKSRKRFFSILMITALGVTMLTGLKAACDDLRYSADHFFDTQNLYDISVMSTLGLTDEDVAALSQLDGVETAEGSYSETVYTQVDDKRQNAEVKVLSAKGMNEPYLLEGVLPQKADEIAVTQKYMKNTGKALGDALTIEEDLETAVLEDSTGDTDEWAEDFEDKAETPTFANTTYKITGVVLDPMDISNNEGASAFRSASNTDFTFFVTPDAVESDVFTAVYLTLTDSRSLICYSDVYKDSVQRVIQAIESKIKTDREQARTQSVTGEAADKITDAEQKMNEQFEMAETEFSDAEKELADGRQKLADGLRELENGTRELADQEQAANAQFEAARQKIDDGYAELIANAAKLKDYSALLDEGEAQLSQGRELLAQKQSEVNTQLQSARNQLDDEQAKLDAAQADLNIQAEALSTTFGPAWPSGQWDVWLTAPAESATDAQAAFMTAFTPVLDKAVQALDAQISALNPDDPDDASLLATLQAQKAQLQVLPKAIPQLAGGLRQLSEGQVALDKNRTKLEQQQSEADTQFKATADTLDQNAIQLAAARAQLTVGRAQLQSGQNQLDAGAAELNAQEENARRQLTEGRQTLENGRQELVDGQAELADGQTELEEKKQEYEDAKIKAEQKLSNARAKLADIDTAKWYVQDRSALGGYASIESDAGSIEAVGTAFPIVFLVVAVLISLTTITRMVEEERGLIGTYKALGYRDAAIYSKYLLYAFAACLAGGILGDICGFILLPKFVFTVFQMLYMLPEYLFQFNLLYGLGGVLLFTVSISGAAAIACRTELIHMPAVLMCPKSPRTGSRVLLERVPAVWNRLSFLNKVTMRNLFRYKKRLFMTVAGIMGCTALVLCGFAIKNSVNDLMPKQYEHIYQYDLMAVTAADDNTEVMDRLSGDKSIAEFINVQTGNVKLKKITDGREEKVQLVVVPDDHSLEGYICLENTNGSPAALPESGVLITENASRMLDLKAGDTLFIQDDQLVQKESTVSGIMRNYLGNAVYMRQSVYEAAFGTYEPNAALAHLSNACTDHMAYADTLGRQDKMLSVSSTAELKESFSSAFSLVNSVVYLITGMAAGLAFIVLFSLSSTNISERTRELASMKVLGFYDKEVHLYVNKETLLLTLIGILMGLPVGRALGGSLTYVLNMPSVHFAVYVEPISYVFTALISFSFALIVNLITNRTLDHIDMIDSLKSVE
ncbi:FtsX-like permease family protein [Eubacterium sp. 1001713B170207_170306_E7]|uniref:FtsX-like permease family protein n=1 Tax=Eubacterium sp. 1001713B170207_170306_E7 TaxID=2787097 RepID=UPI0018990401|nr:FtsX-like permease family protein [Eubacterium sp. 1001713B170207_170306_E7]